MRRGGEAFVVDMVPVPEVKKPCKPRGVAFTVGLDEEANIEQAN